MTTQIKPLSGGAFQTIVKKDNRCADKSTPGVAAMQPGLQHVTLRAMNQWLASGGVGSLALRAQAEINAAGQQLQEI
jgi:aspartate oxidase